MIKPILSHTSQRAGFTLVETMIALFIILIIGTIGISTFYSSKTTKTLEVLADGLDFTLEQAKADAIAGKNGSSFGIQFAASSYTYFVGSTYSSGGAGNMVNAIPEGWLLATDTADGGSKVVFTRLTGVPQTTATITVSNIATPSLTRSITIGPIGNISVIK